MTSSILVCYATTYGSTQEVAETVAAALRECGLPVDVQAASEVRSLDRYSIVVLGAPLFMFRWHKDAVRFLVRHREALLLRHVAIFALGPTHDPHDEAEWQSSRQQLKNELSYFPWLSPLAVEMFGGRYDPLKLRFPLKLMAGKAPPTDIRDWQAVRAWASGLAGMLG